MKHGDGVRPNISHGNSHQALEYDGAVGTAAEAVELCRRTGNKLRRQGGVVLRVGYFPVFQVKFIKI